MRVSPRKKTADYVMEEIKRMIGEGRLREGDKLPNQTDFARHLGVSRLSLREALQTLQQMGVIRQKPKTGTVIICAATDRWAEPIAHPVLEDVDGVFELLRARKVIESAIAAHAAACAGEREIKNLERLADKVEKAFEARDVKAYIDLDVQFHVALTGIPRNRYLSNMYLTICNAMVRYVNEVFSVNPAMWESTIRNHREICGALATGDPAKTVAAVEKEQDADIRFFESYYRRIREM